MDQKKRITTGSFFTPSIWVKKSQKYILKTLGNNWQKEYYIWDCASGTGNLLEGLDTYKKVFASTLEAEEVEIIKERFDIPENNAFQFDFLNDSFDNLPLDLQKIIKDPIKSSKLLIYINPPYGQPSDKSLITSSKKEYMKKGMVETKVRSEFINKIGVGANQLYVQFFLRIYKYIPNCKLACFTGVKYLNSKSFIGFRNYFKAKFLDGFVVPSDTFYNVKGKFPIGFLMWDLSIKEKMKKVALDVFDKEGKRIVGRELDKLIKGTDQYISKGNDKKEYSAKDKDNINKWINQFDYRNKGIGFLKLNSSDFQYNNIIHTTQILSTKKNKNIYINRKNLLPVCIYLSVRHALKNTWLNNDDHFLHPTKKEYSAENEKSIGDWMQKYKVENSNRLSCVIGWLFGINSTNFQNNRLTCIVNRKNQISNTSGAWIAKSNIIPACISLSIRYVLKETWLNNSDQFLHPTKKEYSAENRKSIGDWLREYKAKGNSEYIGWLAGTKNNDFQHNKFIYILNNKDGIFSPTGLWIDKQNLLPTCIYLTNRHIFNHTWLNDGDYFLHPTKKEYSAENEKSIGDWLREYKVEDNNQYIGWMVGTNAGDFQHNKFVCILNSKDGISNPRGEWVNKQNILPNCIYLTARHLFNNAWLNNDDYFLHPTKKEYSAESKKSINEWIDKFDYKGENIGILQKEISDFQHTHFIFINQKEIKRHYKEIHINKQNVLPTCIYLTARLLFNNTWLNTDDSFTHPKTKPLTWKDDKEFQNNCVACTLFHPQNRISAKEGVNHWIPFTEKEVGAKGKFESNFMTNFLNAKLPKDNDGLFECKNDMTPTEPLEFSKEAKDVFKAGLEIYKYYHKKDGSNPNYSLHDIRQHFQGFNSKGIMNSKSKDLEYQKLYDDLKDKLEILATKIRPKIFEYKFLDT